MNVPFDSNGNGTLDSVVVEGDYDGDGHVEPEDIQAAVHAVSQREAGEAGFVTVRAGDYVEVCRGPADPGGYCEGDAYLACDPAAGSADCEAAGLAGAGAACNAIGCEGWNTRAYAGTGEPRDKQAGLVDLDADDSDLSFLCEAGVEIRSLPNKRRFDGVSPSAAASGLGLKTARPFSIRAAQRVSVIGCSFEGGMPRGIGAYDPVAADWPLVAEAGTATTLFDAQATWRDGEWDRWWLMLRPGCDGAGLPRPWCSGPEEIAQIQGTSDASDTLSVAGFTLPPASGDRYVILYRRGGACAGDVTVSCSNLAECSGVGGPCDLSVDDDVGSGSRMTVYVAFAEDVLLSRLRVSGSGHAGVYVKNSLRVELSESELYENGGYYGFGGRHRPSSYWFSGAPEGQCFAGNTDCRLSDFRVEDNEIRHGGTGINLRWSAAPGTLTYLEDMQARDNWIHDLFAADGTGFGAIGCGGRNALCEDNEIERAFRGIEVGGDVALGWASETDPVGKAPNSWGVTVRGNTVRDLWWARGSTSKSTHGVRAASGIEGLSLEDNTVERSGLDVGSPVTGYGINLSGPNRDVELTRNRFVDAPNDLRLDDEDGVGSLPGVWEEWPVLEAESLDVGSDPSGFAASGALDLLVIGIGGRLSLRDGVDDGQRGGPGGDAEAVYVRTLKFKDAGGVLNTNGIQLYYETLDGTPGQIIDFPVSCGNGNLDPGEQCDDGGLVFGDGCSPTCEEEDLAYLYGVAEGGSVELVIDGVALSAVTTPGQSVAEILLDLGEQASEEPALLQLGTSVVTLGTRLVTNGTIESYTISDPGLRDSLPAVPALARSGGLLLAGLLLLGARRLLRR